MHMALSSEDSLRLNVMLANQLQAVRIDEGKMIVYALSPRGEMKIQLNSNCRDEKYIKQVKELLSGHVLGSPGGYPVYLQRWTRMGQARNENLEQLLLLGEPEAVVAVVHAAGLTPELARRAWWAAQSSDNARQMLKKPDVCNSEMGIELTAFLLEFLPFEEDAFTQAETVRLVLQPGLLTADQRDALWKKSQHKNAYLLGFLWGVTEFPEPVPQHENYPQLAERLQALPDNPVAQKLLAMYSSTGQSFIQLAERVLKKPINQDIVNAWLELVSAYFEDCVPPEQSEAEIEVLLVEAENLCHYRPIAEVLQAVPQLAVQLQAMLVLGRLSYAVLRPIFSGSDAIGSLMRKKLTPVSNPLFEQLSILQAPIDF